MWIVKCCLCKPCQEAVTPMSQRLKMQQCVRFNLNMDGASQLSTLAFINLYAPTWCHDVCVTFQVALLIRVYNLICQSKNGFAKYCNKFARSGIDYSTSVIVHDIIARSEYLVDYVYVRIYIYMLSIVIQLSFFKETWHLQLSHSRPFTSSFAGMFLCGFAIGTREQAHHTFHSFHSFALLVTFIQ